MACANSFPTVAAQQRAAKQRNGIAQKRDDWVLRHDAAKAVLVRRSFIIHLPLSN
jgi:hypothetical protein